MTPSGIILARQPLKPAAASGTLSVALGAAWELEEASGTRADARGATPLTEHGSVPNAAGILGNAASYSNNAANYLSADGSRAALNDAANGQFEVSVWVYKTATTTDQSFFSQSTTITNANCSILWVSYFHYFRIWARGVQIDCSTFGNNPAAGVWALCHIYDDGTNAGVLFNNGSGQTAARSANPVGTCQNFQLGYDVSATGPNNGRIDQCFWWIGRSLTTTERAFMYNGGLGRTYADVLAASP